MKQKLDLVLGPLLILSLAVTLFLSFFNFEISKWLVYLDIALVAFSFIYYTLAQHLTKYVFKRVIEALVTLWVIASLTFFALRLMPGGPFDQEKALPPEVKANIEAKYQLNAPLYEQYFNYIGGLLVGDLGESYKYLGRNISEIIAETLPVSVQLGVYSLILAFLIGIPAGVYSASKHNTAIDGLTMMFAISGVALPSFLIAPIVIWIFSFHLGWFEPALWEGPLYYILPVIVLGTRPAAVIARLTRASVLEVIRSDYIRTAKAKGLSNATVLYKHVLKNSLIPVLTYSGPLAAGILTGTFVIEQIFAIPGLGKHLILSVSNRDYPLILGTTFIFSLALVAANLIVDLLYAYFDPRIKLS